MATVTVLGAGMMGTALCIPLVDAGHEVRLVGTHLDREIISSLEQVGVHPRLGLALPGSIRPYALEGLAEAMEGADLIGLGVSSAGVRWAAERLAPFVRRGTPVVMISKGLDFAQQELRILPDLLLESWRGRVDAPPSPAAIAGPCIAGELARRVPTCVVLTGRDAAVIEQIRRLISAAYYRVFTSTDMVGVELCAALKNAYAMGVGMAAGLHERGGGQTGSIAMHNYEAAVFAQAIWETERLVVACGGQQATVLGLAGTGDLTVTCHGGRTSRFGRWLGLGLSPVEAMARMRGATLECLEVLRVLKAALPALGQRGLIDPGSLPLLSHLMEVALFGAAVNLPFDRFFAHSDR